MKTAMQELIELLKIEENSISDNDSHEDRCWRNGVRCSIKKAIELLEKEKEQHKETWELSREQNDMKVDNHYIGSDYLDFEQYYNQTYNN